MFFEFLKLELRSAFRSPMLYIFFFLITLMAFGAVASDNVTIGGSIGNVYRNAPYTLTNFVLILGLFAVLFAAAFFNNAALRDHNSQFNEIMFHLPIGKGGYFWGRFIGALILSTIPLLGIFAGAWLGAVIAPLAGWIDPERIGPFYFETLVNNYFIFILPNMFFAGSIIFFLAQKFKSTIISFVGALAIFVAYFVSGTLLSDIDNESIAALTDVFGIGTFDVYSRYFTPIEKNTLSPQFEGLLLQNRLIWLSVGIVISIISYFSFSFKEKLRFRKRRRKEVREEYTPITHIPAVSQNFGEGIGWKQFKSFYHANLLSITKSVVFKIVAIFGILLLFASLVGGYEYFGLQSYPVTYRVISDIASSTGLFMTIVIVFFSGELVWRDRISNIQEVINSTPHNSHVSAFAKVASLVSVAVLLQFVFIAMGVLSQLFRGYTHIELDVYLVDFFVDSLPGYIVFAAIFVFVQTLVGNPYVGYFVGILVIFAWSIVLSVLEWSSNMLAPGASPGIFYSDMSGFGPGMVGTLWFDLYWILTSVILIYFAGLFWPRSVVSGFREKLGIARANFTGKTRNAFAFLAVAWLLVAGFIFYNTQMLNDYPNQDTQEQMSIKYEETYKKYENQLLPVLTDINYFIDIFPSKRDVYVKAEARFINKGDAPIDSLFFNLDPDWNPRLTIPNSELVLDDTELDFQIYKLKNPLHPGESIDLKIETSYITKGFTNGIGNTNILSNGTFLNNMEILPSMGYSESVEISDKNDRKKFGLPIKSRMPELEANCTNKCMKNYLSNGLSDWVNVETTISTSDDQTAVAPGSLIKEWTEGDRKYFQYKVDHPSQNFYSFMSARYEVAREKHNDIDIEIYYDTKHGVNIPKMVDAVRKSLTYYEENFGPYYHKQARILEFPRYSNFAQAFPGTMPYAESFGFITNLEDETDNNVVEAVIAHEMAHQWWAHQEIPALMQGATMLTESFSEYSSLMVMKQESNGDDMKMKNFLKYDYNRYLRGRSSEAEKELPLYKVENQQYIHYGKGSVILYALQDYIGEDSVNAALESFLKEYAYAEPPYPTTLNFLDYLEPRVPDSLQYLIKDWFKEITLYDFRLKSASAKKRSDGKYDISFDIEAHKMYADTIGNETPQPLNEWVDLGFYSDSDAEKLQNWKRVNITDEQSTFTLIADSLPAKAAIDPRRMFIERVIDDNVKSIDLEE
ncbi:hypothetical protein G3O08_03940 [Cryomorpha ignava]|uniref:Peptidase M1 membrane alanine aminopeptidase domain-containing protein n=1 Tax=Cryomorpha ignava TaxID=101383 RepID=A0A7K3WLX9_9FLAO|nr:M1 family aminopeptidase [Cryomorpha ignava]NEN22656.1 hypothetical protein [Cryomorpha ignava]